jgi:hypothetical protein
MKLLKFGYKILMHSRYYKIWSKLYRFLFERKYKNYGVKYKQNINDLEKEIMKIKWTADGPKQLWDTVSFPGKGQYFLDEINAGQIQPKGSFDCDDFASYTYAAHDVSLFLSSKYLLSIGYKKSNGKISGHMVYVFRDLVTNEYMHLSNWGLFRGFSSIEEIVLNILSEDKTLIGYSLFANPWTLKLLLCKTEIKKENL